MTPLASLGLACPDPVPVDLAEFRRYAAAVQAEADPYGLRLEGSTPAAGGLSTPAEVVYREY